MSSYRDDHEAARARIETLEAKLREREAGLDARDAEISELRAELARWRQGGIPPPPHGSSRLVVAFVGVAVLLAGIGAALFFVRVAPPSPPPVVVVEPKAPEPPPAPTPTPAPAPPPVPPAASSEAVDQEAIASAIASTRGPMKRCFEQEVAKRPDVGGKVTITLTASGGKITKVVFGSSPLRSPKFDACAEKCFRGLAVPKTDGPTEINVPFVFTSK